MKTGNQGPDWSVDFAMALMKVNVSMLAHSQRLTKYASIIIGLKGEVSMLVTNRQRLL